MRLVPLLLLLLALLATATPADAACREGARTTEAKARKSVIRSAVVVCRNGREKTVRRGTISTKAGGRGTYYGDAAFGDGRLALSSVVRAKGYATNVIELVSAGSHRRLFRDAHRYLDDDDSEYVFADDVAMTENGALAWTRLGSQVWLRRPDGLVTKLPIRDGESGDLAIEDGITLRFGSSRQLQFRDLAKPAGRPCPKRERFRASGTLGTLRLSTASYVVDDERSTAIRACDPATGVDAVLGTTFREGVARAELTPLAYTAPFVLLTRSERDGSGECPTHEIAVVDLRKGRSARRARFRVACRPPATVPKPGQPMVITSTGTPAWIADGKLHAITARGNVATIDAGPVTDLTASGAAIRWRHGGVDRTATL